MEVVEQVGDVAVDVLASVVGVEGLDGEGEGGEEVLQHEDHEVLGDARHGAKVLELRDFVDDVEDVDALLAVVVAEVDGGRGSGFVRCEVSRSSSNDLFAPDFRLTPRWKTESRSGSLPVGQD